MGQINLTKMIPFEGQMTQSMSKKKDNAMRKTKVVDKSLYTRVEDKSKTTKTWVEVLKSDTKRIEEIRNRTKPI